MTNSKKSKGKSVKKIIKKIPVSSSRRKLNPLHDRLIKLFSKSGGCTMHDTWNTGWKYPAMAALKIAKRRGLKIQVIKKKGQLTRYCAKRR